MSVNAPPAVTTPYLDLHHGAEGLRLDRAITDRRAWTRETLSASDWTVAIDAAAEAEIRELAAALARDPLPTLLIAPDTCPPPINRSVACTHGRSPGTDLKRNL